MARLQLDYAQATDLYPNPNPGTALVRATWTNWFTSQSFNVDRAGSLIMATLRQRGLIYTGDQAHAIVVWRFNIDSGAQTKRICGVTWNQGASEVALGEMGGVAFFSGLSVGSHNIAVQYFNYYPTDYPSHTNTTAFLRPTATVDGDGASAPNLAQVEFLELQVVELG